MWHWAPSRQLSLPATIHKTCVTRQHASTWGFTGKVASGLSLLKKPHQQKCVLIALSDGDYTGIHPGQGEAGPEISVI